MVGKSTTKLINPAQCPDGDSPSPISRRGFCCKATGAVGALGLQLALGRIDGKILFAELAGSRPKAILQNSGSKSSKIRMMTTVSLPPWREPAIFADLLEMCRRSATTDVAVMMMGIPQADKRFEGTIQGLNQFAHIKEILEPHGIRAGILIQSLLGHGERGEPRSPLPYQRMVGWDGEENRSCFCPLDPGFLTHMQRVVQMMAAAGPAFLLVDDDVRLNNHLPARWCCACPLHVAYFNRLAHRDLSREAIFQAMRGEDDKAKAIRDSWFDSGERSLMALAKAIRQAIDQADPNLRCGKCLSGGRHLLLTEPLARELAGKTKPMVRLAGAMYLHSGYNDFPKVMAGLTMQRNLMADDIEYLSEADSFPQTLYSTSCKTLRGYVAGSILAAKVDVPYTWVPSPTEWVLTEWDAYADTLGRSVSFFQALSDLSKKVRWMGPTAVCLRVHNFVPDPLHMPPAETLTDIAWGGQICGRMGIPFTVNDPDARTVMLNGTSVYELTVEEVRRYLRGGVLLDGAAAWELYQRGFGEYLGVDIHKPTASLEVAEEIITGDAMNGKAAGMHVSSMVSGPSDVMRLSPQTEGTLVLSWLVRNRWYHDPDFRKIAPALTVYANKLGGRVAVYAYDLNATLAMVFLNWIRRQQIIAVLEWLEGGPLPAVAETAADTYTLFGRNHPDQEYVSALFNLNSDHAEGSVNLRWNELAPKHVLCLDDDGAWRELGFELMDRSIHLKTSLETMKPLILRIRQ